MRTIIAGSREIEDRDLVFKLIEQAKWPPTLVLSGTAAGVDRLGEKWAIERGLPVKRYPPNWLSLGKKAGPIRNQQMVDDGEQLIVIRYDHSKGSADVLRRAQSKGLVINDFVLPKGAATR